MISIPLYFFLFAYFFFLVAFLVFSVINLSHIFQTGGVTFTSFVVTAIMFALIIFTLFATWFLLKDVSWTNTWEVTNWFSNNSTDIF